MTITLKMALLVLGVMTVTGLAPAQDEVGKPSRSFGGPDGVSEELQRSEQPDSVYGRVKQIESWSDWKKQLKADHGLSFGLSAILNYQLASDVLPLGEDDAGWGIYRFNGSWELYDRDGKNPGRFEWRGDVQFRDAILSLQPAEGLS